MDLHGEAISRMMERVADKASILDSFAGDPVISSLLLVYNQHPQSLEQRVNAALDSVRPYLASHGGSVKLLGISDDGIVRLQMQGSCHGCPSSAVTLKDSIEKAIMEKAPDVSFIHVENLNDSNHHDHNAATPKPDGFVPLEQLTGHALRQGNNLAAHAAAISGALS
ncbi:MAG: NifU family protein [Phycisphaerae bacterium]|nr:NifU family protein [Phycisphaerae bacterium]